MTDELPQRRQLDPHIVAITERLDRGDARFSKIEDALVENTQITQRIADSISGIVAFSDDLAAGSRLICRIAKGIKFMLDDVIEPYWKPALVIFLAIYWLTHGHTLPAWAMNAFNTLFGGMITP